MSVALRGHLTSHLARGSTQVRFGPPRRLAKPAKRGGPVYAGPPKPVAERTDTADAQQVLKAVNAARNQSEIANSTGREQDSPPNDFLSKVKAAWRIFFPPQAKPLTAKEEGKHRLRMILVADRCGMNQTALTDMKSSIVQAVSNYVDIEAEELVDVAVTSDPEMGAIYVVSVPIKKVKATARVDLDDEGVSPEGITIEWDQEDWDADPSGRFPFGC